MRDGYINTGVPLPLARVAANLRTQRRQRIYADGMLAVARRWLSCSVAALRVALEDQQLRRVQLGWACSTAGEFISIIALGLFAYQAGGATAVGVVAVVQMVPAMLLSPVVGVLGDRFRRELVVIGADALRGTVMGLAAVAAASDAPVATVYVLAAVLALGSHAYYRRRPHSSRCWRVRPTTSPLRAPRRASSGTRPAS